jgi:dolichol-phosphate mannosyltransferase
LIEPIITGACDVTVGSRHVEGGRIVGWPIRRHLTSRVAAWLASPFVDITDPMSGFFATRRERFASVNADVAGFKILLELLSSQQGRARVCEVPIEFRDREHGESKLSGGVIRSYLLQLKRLSGVHSTTGTMARFGLVGVGGVVVDLSIFAVLTAIGLTIGSAHISSFLVATLFNYVLNNSWSFRRADAS